MEKMATLDSGPVNSNSRYVTCAAKMCPNRFFRKSPFCYYIEKRTYQSHSELFQLLCITGRN